MKSIGITFAVSPYVADLIKKADAQILDLSNERAVSFLQQMADRDGFNISDYDMELVSVLPADIDDSSYFNVTYKFVRKNEEAK